jgi:hypothetical protein
MASLEDRLAALEARRSPTTGPTTPPPESTAILKFLNNARLEIDRRDVVETGLQDDTRFGDDWPEPEPLTLDERRALLSIDTEGLVILREQFGPLSPEMEQEAAESKERQRVEIAELESMEARMEGDEK